MNPYEAVKALSAEFAVAFPLKTPTASIQYEGAQNITPAVTASWVRFGVRPTRDELNALGSPRLFTNAGLIAVQVFTPLNKGRGANDALAESAASVFRGRADIGDGIRIGDISYNTVGPAEGFFQQTLLIAYEADDLDS